MLLANPIVQTTIILRVGVGIVAQYLNETGNWLQVHFLRNAVSNTKQGRQIQAHMLTVHNRMRLDCLDELLGSEDLASNIDQCLKKLPKDLDK